MKLEDVQKQFRAGKRLKYLLFWGHQPARSGEVGASCLSNWYSASFDVAGHRYLTGEHFMMAEKARLFGDEEVLGEILKASNPGAAKHLGRCVRNFEEDAWIEHRFDVVVRGNEARFAQNPPLRDYLVNTKSRVLVEASPTDRIWGIGLAKDDPRAESPLEWKGLNLLGFALMEVRERLTKR